MWVCRLKHFFTTYTERFLGSCCHSGGRWWLCTFSLWSRPGQRPANTGLRGTDPTLSQKLRVTETPQNLHCPSVSEGGLFWDTPRQIPNLGVLTPPAARQAAGSRSCGLPATGGNRGGVLGENSRASRPARPQGQLRFLTAEVFPSHAGFVRRARHPALQNGRPASGSLAVRGSRRL